MPIKHPYVVGAGGLNKTVAQFRKSFPPEVTAATLKKLGIAPNNESYVINTLRFLNLIDDKGKKSKEAGSVFSNHADDAFQAAFAELVKKSYGGLFTLHGDATWSLPSDHLISYFRVTDESSAIVGQRQASTFQALAVLAGKTPMPSAAPQGATPPTKAKGVPRPKKKPPADLPVTQPAGKEGSVGARELGLTVRIEINLPAVADQTTYDAIFASIRKNLIKNG